MQIFQFNKVNNTLTAGPSASLCAPSYVNWSPDGQYIAVGLCQSNGFKLYNFNRSTNTLTAGPAGLTNS